jgi:hypothetical protein
VIAIDPEGYRYEFDSLSAYETSALWGLTRERYRLSDRAWACMVCGSEQVQLHHLSYERIGREPLDDLVPLCQHHHYEVEKRIRAWPALTRREATVAYLAACLERSERHHARPPRRLNPMACLDRPLLVAANQTNNQEAL